MKKRVFTYEIQVRWGDSDRLGHVNNTRFVEYMQEARAHFLSSELAAVGARAGAMVVRKMDVDFLRPISDDSGPLKVDVTVVDVGTSSYTIHHVITNRHGAVCGTGDALLVAFDVKKERSRPLSDAERAGLERYLAPVRVC
ncbi:acyl-CoA thioesterase [Rhodococcus marinonascens]|uniref:acyl-CoA thioesterase n=1 Tax=Rhodococcus marinonascens TaxID=38311 RepID=UPI0009336687|nr:thioesterase family protein [Rhodococcus marinonascens]